MSSTLISAAHAGDDAAIAVFVALLHGARASEITGRTIRDLDGGGRLLRITEAKSPKGVRTLRLAPWLQPHLLKLSEGRSPGELLFRGGRHWLHHHTVRFCRLAGVPRVTPHGLRATFASLDVEGADLMARTADRLGHESFTTTARHYALPEAVNAGQTARVTLILNAALKREGIRKSAL